MKTPVERGFLATLRLQAKDGEAPRA